MTTFERSDFSAWYQDHQVDLGWLPHPSRHQFRWRTCHRGWMTANRRFHDAGRLTHVLKQHGPRDVFVGTSAWLDPIDLPRIKETHLPHPILLDHLIVFDIDVQPFSIQSIERARKTTYRLLKWVRERYDVMLLAISYSGSKGFHLIFQDNVRTLFEEPDPRQREVMVKENRKALLQSVLDAGFEVDPTVTADTRRIIRLPGSLHGTSGWACTRIDEQWLSIPFNQWANHIPKIVGAQYPPKRKMMFNLVRFNPLQWLSSALHKSKTTRVQHTPSTVFQVSSHVTGTKNRSALLAYIPNHWKEEHLQDVERRLKGIGISSVYHFSNGTKHLIIGPHAVVNTQLQKVLRAVGWLPYSNQIEALGHYWVDLIHVDETMNLESNFHFHGTWRTMNDLHSHHPLSKTHVDLIERLSGQSFPLMMESAGKSQPSYRTVVRV